MIAALTHHAGIRLAEVGFLLILIAGVWLVFAEILDPAKWRKFRTIVSGVLLAIAGLLLIIATHWDKFG
jgi:predicted metal-binding membrane protein